MHTATATNTETQIYSIFSISFEAEKPIEKEEEENETNKMQTEQTGKCSLCISESCRAIVFGELSERSETLKKAEQRPKEKSKTKI